MNAAFRIPRPHSRCVLLGAVLPVLALLLAAFVAPPAHAADQGGYRYWSFWLQEEGGKGTGPWSYATEGPATQRPEDGDTLGFRFALSADSKDAAQPRGAASFTAACADTAEKSGMKRISIRIDFGTGADAPKGEPKSPPKPRTACARVDSGATAAEALAAVAEPLRYNSDSLLCAIDGYPTKGCGEQAGKSDTAKDGARQADSEDSADKDDGSDAMSTGLGVAAGIAAVVVLGGAALWQARRRRQ